MRVMKGFFSVFAIPLCETRCPAVRGGLLIFQGFVSQEVLRGVISKTEAMSL